MSQIEFKRGRDELDASRRDMRGLLIAAFVFSVFVNALMLTGPLYMLQVYDRVLGSRSEPTLWALTGLMAFMFVIMGVLDYTRGRIMARVGARMQERLDRRVFSAALRRMPGTPMALPFRPSGVMSSGAWLMLAGELWKKGSANVAVVSSSLTPTLRSLPSPSR